MKIETAEFVRSAHRGEDLLADGRPEVAFVGRSNVGKSSLMNRLLGRRDLARTSSTPGRTRSVNYFLLNRRFYFVDLPGYGYAKASKSERRAWGALVESYFERPAGPHEVRVVQLIDAKVGATDLDAEAHRYLTALGRPVTVVATKIDRIGRSRQAAALAAVRSRLGHESQPLPVSARSGEGIKELWRVIDSYLLNSASSLN